MHTADRVRARIWPHVSLPVAEYLVTVMIAHRLGDFVVNPF